MSLLQWTLFCRRHGHLLTGIMHANPPGGISDFSRAYVKLASEEHMIQVLAEWQMHEHRVAPLNHVLSNYGPLAGLVNLARPIEEDYAVFPPQSSKEKWSRKA